MTREMHDWLTNNYYAYIVQYVKKYLFIKDQN